MMKMTKYILSIATMLIVSGCTTPLPLFRLEPVEWCSRDRNNPHQVRCGHRIYRHPDYVEKPCNAWEGCGDA